MLEKRKTYLIDHIRKNPKGSWLESHIFCSQWKRLHLQAKEIKNWGLKSDY
jgi:hypothetical protein